MSRKAFPGFMGKAQVRATGSLQGSQDLTVSPSGDFSVVLGPAASVVAPKFRIVDVAGNVIWAEDDQTHVFQERKGRKDVLVFRLRGDDVTIPTTGASLYIRIGDEETKLTLIRKSSPFEVAAVESTSRSTATPAAAPVAAVEIKPIPEDDDVFDYYTKRVGILHRVRLTWANIITALRGLFYTKSEIDAQLEGLGGGGGSTLPTFLELEFSEPVTFDADALAYLSSVHVESAVDFTIGPFTGGTEGQRISLHIYATNDLTISFNNWTPLPMDQLFDGFVRDYVGRIIEFTYYRGVWVITEDSSYDYD